MISCVFVETLENFQKHLYEQNVDYMYKMVKIMVKCS